MTLKEKKQRRIEEFKKSQMEISAAAARVSLSTDNSVVPSAPTCGFSNPPPPQEVSLDQADNEDNNNVTLRQRRGSKA